MSTMLSVLKLDTSPRVTISYGATFGSEEYKLLEVDEEMLRELLCDGLNLKGNPDEEAVLCTSSATYAVKLVDTSNTVLLFPPQQQSRRVITSSSGEEPVVEAAATASGHLELLETAPRVEILKALLSQRPYAEDLDDESRIDEDNKGLYTWDDLVANVQASDDQLRDALKTVDAVLIGQHWRIVDSGFMECLLEVLLLNAVQHEWPLNALPGLEVFRVLQSDKYSSHIIRHCLNTYGARVEIDTSQHSNVQDLGIRGATSSDPFEASTMGTSEQWIMDEKKVCRHYAKKLLAWNSKWRMGDFLEAWERLLPSGLHATLDMLKGEVLVEQMGPEQWLHLFSISTLPSKPNERFLALFKRRTKWEWADLEPYLSDLHVPGLSVEAMLLKYTRKTQPLAISAPIYTAR